MKAKDLVGKRVLRTRPVIIDEKNKVIDLDFMDPKNPSTILRYNEKDKGITLITKQGQRNYCTNEYDDDGWIPEDLYDPNDVYIPSGYKSIDMILMEHGITDDDSAPKVNTSQLSLVNESFSQCVNAIEGLLEEKRDIVVRLLGGDTRCANAYIHIKYMADNLNTIGIAVLHKSVVKSVDITISDCEEFNEILYYNLTRRIEFMVDLRMMELYREYAFGYKALNNIIRNEDPDSVYIYVDGFIVFGEIEHGMMYLFLADDMSQVDPFDVEHSVVLSHEESVDIINRMNEDYKNEGFEYFELG